MPPTPPQPGFTTAPVRGSAVSRRRLAGLALRRPGGRRALSVVTALLLLAGVGLFSYPFVTDLLQHQRQGSLRKQFADPTYATTYRDHQVKVGDGLTELKIPSIGVDVLVVEGTTPAALRAGAGHYVGTPLPGEAGNVAIAGHRTTYGRPFNRLDEVEPGQEVELDTPLAKYFYVAVPDADFTPANPHPVAPTDVSVLQAPADPGAHLLTLTTCHPKGSAAERLILRASLEPQKTIVLTPGG